MGELTDSKVLVIGRPSGIARAIALAASAEGAHVIVAGRNAGALTDAYASDAIAIETVDVTDQNSIVALAGRLGTVDHVVSTASARARGEIGDLTAEALALSFATKATGPLLLAKHLAPIMPATGSFVLFSGVTAVRPSIGMLAVSATNGAVDALTRGLAVELAPIRVNAIAPGTIDTGAYDGLGADRKEALFARRRAAVPAGRIGRPEDVAQAVLFALNADFVTGATIPVDGGELLV